MIKNLKYLRHEKGITQKELASVLGVSQQSVNKYENHDVEPDLATIMKMADYFGISVDLLIGHTADETTDPTLRTSDSDEVALLKAYRILSGAQKTLVRSLAESYKS